MSEATLVNLQIRLVSDKKLKRYPANSIQNDAEEAVYAVEAAWRRRKELQGAAGGLFSLGQTIERLMVNKLNKQTNKNKAKQRLF